MQEKRVALVGPVNGLTAELQNGVQKFLTVEQLARGAVPPAPTPVRQLDQRVMYGLVTFGALLMLGLFSRAAALGAATMLFSFYPGVRASR